MHLFGIYRWDATKLTCVSKWWESKCRCVWPGLVGGLMLSFIFHLLAAVSLHSFFRLWNLPSQAFCADCGCEFFEKRSREFVGLIHFEIALCVQWFYQPIFLLYNCELCKRLSHSLQLHSTRTLFSSLSRFRIVRFLFHFREPSFCS